MLGAAFLLVAGGAATVAAVDTTGSNISLNGSDTLFDVTQDVIAACKLQFTDFASQNVTYSGGGIGHGCVADGPQQPAGGADVARSQGRQLGEYCATPAPSAAGLTEGLLLGIDGIAIVANTVNSCSDTMGAANGLGKTAAFAVTADGTSTGGTPPTCPGCDGSDFAVRARSSGRCCATSRAAFCRSKHLCARLGPG